MLPPGGLISVPGGFLSIPDFHCRRLNLIPHKAASPRRELRFFLSNSNSFPAGKNFQTNIVSLREPLAFGGLAYFIDVQMSTTTDLGKSVLRFLGICDTQVNCPA
jgi:hypothetical protein